MLAVAATKHHDELLADFQQYYHLPLPDLSQDATASELERAAILCAQLPEDSRLNKALNPSHEWSIEANLLRLIEYEMHLMLWGMSDSKRRGDPPKPIPTPAEEKAKASLIEVAESVELAVAEAFNL